MSDTPDYLDALHTFYSERLKTGLKKKFSTCKGCKDKKQFIIKEGKYSIILGNGHYGEFINDVKEKSKKL